jgi:hypothetical protein
MCKTLAKCQAAPGLLWTSAGACVCQENPRAQDCLRACSIKVRCSFSCSFVWTMRNMSAKSSCRMSLRPASAEVIASEQTLNATVTSAIMVLHRHRSYWHTDACKQQSCRDAFHLLVLRLIMCLQNCIKTFLQLFVSLCTDLLCSTEFIKVLLSCPGFTRQGGHFLAGCPNQF